MAKRRERAWRRLLAGLLVLPFVLPMAGGCSLALVTGPPSRPQVDSPPSCTTSKGLPLADAIGGGLTLLVSLALIGLNADQPATSLAPFFLAGASGTALLLYSAAIGDTRVDACREWKAKAPAVMTRPPREPARIAPRPAPVAPPTVAPLPPDPLVPQRADPE